VIKMTPAKRAKALKGQLADSEQKAKSATHETEKERIKTKRLRGLPIKIADLEPYSKSDLAEVLDETGGAVRKKDTWEDLAEKVCKPNPPPNTMQPQRSKKARPAADEDDAREISERPHP